MIINKNNLPFSFVDRLSFRSRNKSYSFPFSSFALEHKILWEDLFRHDLLFLIRLIYAIHNKSIQSFKKNEPILCFCKNTN